MLLLISMLAIKGSILHYFGGAACRAIWQIITRYLMDEGKMNDSHGISQCKCSRYFTNIGKMSMYFLHSERLSFLFYMW